MLTVAVTLLFLHFDLSTGTSLPVRSGAVVEGKGGFHIVEDVKHPEAIGSAAFLDAEHAESGWGQLLVNTNAGHPDDKQMWAAGFLEGYFTASRIYDHHINMKSFFNITGEGPSNWLLEQDAWARQQADLNASSPLWQTMRLILKQHEGIMAGYNAAANASARRENGAHRLPPLDRVDFLLLSAVGKHLTLLEPYCSEDVEQQMTGKSFTNIVISRLGV